VNGDKGDNDRRKKLDAAGQIEGRPHGRAPNPRGKYLGEEGPIPPKHARPPPDEEHADKNERGHRDKGLKKNGDHQKPRGHDDGKQGVGRSSTYLVRNMTKGGITQKTPCLCDKHPESRLCHRKSPLLMEVGREPGVGKPVGAHVKDGQDKGKKAISPKSRRRFTLPTP